MASNSPTLMMGGVATTEARSERRPGFFARAFERYMQARMRQGEAQVKRYLAHLSDPRLSDLGFTAEEIKVLRTEGRIPASYWV